MKKIVMGLVTILMMGLVSACTYSVDNKSGNNAAEDTNDTAVIVSNFTVVGCDRLSGLGGETVVAKALLLSDTLDSKSSVYVESDAFSSESVVVDNTSDGRGVIMESTMLSALNDTGKPRRAVIYLKALLDSGTTRLGSVVCVQPSVAVDVNAS